MIKTFSHKGLALFYRTGNTKGIKHTHAGKLRLQLAILDSAAIVTDIDKPGYKLHPLKGHKYLTWSIKINANWRLTFKFMDGNVHQLNYEDYH
jgi:proteic killer suppression protein